MRLSHPAFLFVRGNFAKDLDVVNKLVIGARQRLDSLLLGRPASLRCFNGRFQVLQHLHLPGGGSICREGRSRSTVRWGVGGGRIALSLPRRPVASCQLAVSDAPIAAGSTSRHTGTVTALLLVRPRHGALFQSRGGKPIRSTGRSGSTTIPDHRQTRSGQICLSSACFESFRWRSICDHPVGHQP